ncbi:hypothetical protein C6P40_000762 [Pichia californica]|uniref:beta-glucosidase n=1 Tax=Pichia californica TaxID=460514 RepID=A0A9P7BF61_9ASCO|nr:hypothetical protein C6P40_000762 [[Candida] californica]
MSFDPEYVLSQLTIDEKLSLTSAYDFWHTPAIPRLQVPSIRCSDGPNGLRGTRFFNPVPAAVFPNGTSLAATFNKNILHNAGKLMALEAKSKGIHIILGPTINILRSPLYGRGFESFSEDPYLTGLVAAEIINGMQTEGVLSALKHFVCNEIEDKRLGSNSILTNRALREIYLKPFEIVLKNSDPGVIMSSYNKVNGTHCSNSKELLSDILRNEWNFEGMVISDWGGTYSIKEGFEAGLDLEFPGPAKFRTPTILQHLITSMELSTLQIDTTALRVLKTIARCVKSGIPSNGEETTENNNENTSLQLRQLSADGIVLLKNDLNTLPLSKKDNLCIIGPNARSPCYCGGGSASLTPYYTTTIYDSIKEYIGYTPDFTVGCYSFKKSPSIPLYVSLDETKIGFKTKFFDKPADDNTRSLLEECVLDATHISFYDYGADKYPSMGYCVDMEGYYHCSETAKYSFGLSVLGTAKLFINDKLVLELKSTENDVVGFFTEDFNEIHKTLELKEGSTYKITVLFQSPQRLPFKVASECGGGTINFGLSKVIDPLQEIENAKKLAASHDKVVLCIGLNKEWESEGFDRDTMSLPGYTDKLVKSVLEVNKNTVIVNQTGTPVELPWLDDAHTLVHAWYGGNELGNAVTDVLFGEVTPSGKLPMTFPFKNKDNPTYLTYKSDGGNVIYGEDIFVGYKYYDSLEKEVAFPFGYGLSYTEFLISNLKVNFDNNSDFIDISVDVLNGGDILGSEVVQVYTTFKGKLDALKTVKSFRDFAKVALDPKEKKSVHLKLSKKDISSVWADERKQWKSVPGEYTILVGNSSHNLKLSKTIKLDFNLYYWL